ncbi:MAG: hypothetical protein UU47_C0022G0017 [candidate division TM6 bacterium GW2011_GWE2_41_16]|nr:MAG: hypothetical protein UU47_C0022G0017 [candidate division TM6 bacterium GW2011_GWE2_41_16]
MVLNLSYTDPFLATKKAHVFHARLYKFSLAGAEGFEPPNARTKTWCLTAWRRPKNP